MVSKQLRLRASTTLSQVPGSYLYHINPSHDSLAVLTSADEIIIVDQNTLKAVRSLSGVPNGATCLSGNGPLACSGRDGSIVLFDTRSQESITRLQAEESRAITSVAVDDTKVACGTELSKSQALLHVWDFRQKKILWQSRESHNDDITQVKIHPSNRTHILSGSTDGLISLSDMNVSDEEDALVQIINHGSIHKAGFLTEKFVYALSHDEQLSIHPVNGPDEGMAEPNPVHFGDIRLKASCDYAIDILPMTQNNVLALGSNRSKQQVDLIQFIPEPSWALEYSSAWSFPGAQEDEIVRSIYVNEVSQTVFSAAEDGMLRAFRASEGESGQANQGIKASKKGKDQRFKPY